MNRLNNVFSLAGGILVGCVASVLIVGVTGERTIVRAQTPGTQKPNILFIMGDDIGWMQPSTRTEQSENARSNH